MNEAVHAKFGMGASVLRTEDDAFATGRGSYTSDFSPEGVVHGFVLRSPYAHARFTIEDTSQAAAADGVHCVLTASDLTDLKPLPHTTGLKQENGDPITNRDIPILCDGMVRYVGDAIAFIVADTVDQAKDAAELIEIDFDMLPAVVDTVGALDPDAPKVYDDSDSNLAFTLFLGDRDETEKAFANAAHVSDIEIVNNRIVCNYMETRACLGEYSEADGYKLTVGSQGVHSMQRAMAQSLGEELSRVRVVTPDVGGGFGTKLFPYREYPLALAAAKKLGRPVKWTSERSEHFVADSHGRDNVVKASMAMDGNGKFLAVKVDIVAAMGAYLHTFGPYIPWLGMTMTTGTYDIPVMAVCCRGSYTNTTFLDAYRGAGRPEAAYLIERLVDKCARELNITPAEMRELNFIKPEQMPYTTPGKRMYDTGEFAGHMHRCLDIADWKGFEERRERARAAGKVRGFGMSSYIEACSFAGSEPAYATLLDDGGIKIRIGTQSNGQGHKTAYAQLAAEKFNMDISRISVHQGDTNELEKGGGTGGSRSIPLGAPSVVQASEALAEKIRKIAADRLEAAPEDIELADGEARIVGTDRSVTLATLAENASEEDRNAQGEFKQAEATYPNGTHVCEVEIDPETGVTEIIAYTIVDDFGATVNPILLQGQVHGGVVQSIGQCLTERVVYDDEGQLLTATFMDYALPRAADVPNFSFETRNVPSTTNAMGIKGAGEAGTIGATPAIMNAVGDALYREYGIKHIDMPAVPQIVWSAIQSARG